MLAFIAVLILSAYLFRSLWEARQEQYPDEGYWPELLFLSRKTKDKDARHGKVILVEPKPTQFKDELDKVPKE